MRICVHVAALALTLALPGRAVTVAEVLERFTLASYAGTHAGLYINNGHNRGFTADPAVRVPALQHDAARDFIRGEFAACGLETYLDPFTFLRGAVLYTNCNNVVAIQRGAGLNPGWVIFGAHYDSVDVGQGSQQSPGADDNASGTAAVVELARVLSGYTFRDHIVYIAFDAEEKGLHGAWHFADHRTTADPADPTRIPRSSVRGMISLDMIAFNPGGVSHNMARIYGGRTAASSPLQNGLFRALEDHTDIAPVFSGAIASSDHHPFHSRGMDAALLIEHGVWSNPHYHKTTDSADTPDFLDYPYAVKMTRAVAAYAMEAAGVVLPPTLAAPISDPAGELSLSWTAQSGSVYRVEYTDRLEKEAEWHLLHEVTNTQGLPFLDFQIPPVPRERRYYRIEHRPAP